MMGIDGNKQNQFMFINLDELVPEDHVLRLIRKTIDFSFIYEKVAHLYSPVGRRSIDPVLLMKMVLVGYLFGIPSERKLEQEVTLNLAYRWFLGLDLGEPVPDHSTICQNRRPRFKESTIFQDIFDQIVSYCIGAGLVTGKIVVTDSTHIKASASDHKVEKVWVDKRPSEYLESLEQEVQKLEKELQQKRDEQGRKKAGPLKQPAPGVMAQQEITRSKTDPDAGWMNRKRKPTGYHYLNHVTLDTKHGIITDVHVTPGNANDHEPYVKRLARIQNTFKLTIQKAGADKGYDTASVHKELEQLGIEGYISPIEPNANIERIDGQEFLYNKDDDAYTCPTGKTLRFTYIDKTGSTYYRKIYAAKTKDCKICPLREVCFSASQSYRQIKRPLFHQALENNKIRARTPQYK